MLIKYTANTFLFLCCFYFIFNGAFIFFKENIGTEIKDYDAYNFPLPSVAFCRNQGEGKTTVATGVALINFANNFSP